MTGNIRRIYFEGVGWIPFEPTPGYLGMRGVSWGTRKAKEAAGEADVRTAEYDERTEEEQSAAEGSQDMSEDDKGQRDFWRILGLTGLWMFSITLALFLMNRLFVRFRYERMDQTEKFKMEVYRNLRILAFMGIRREPGETLEEFRKRAGDLLEDGDGLTFLENYEDFYYGDKAVETVMLEEVRRQQKKLLEFLKRRRKWGYACYRLFQSI